MLKYSFRKISFLGLALTLIAAFFVIQTYQSTASAQTTDTIRFAAIGDYGDDGTAEADVANLVKGWNPDFIITLGDNNYDFGSADTIDANIGQFYHSYIYPYSGSFCCVSIDNVNHFFPSLGNHDWETTNAQPYLDYFTLPGNERYYTFTQGPVQFFVIDSDSREPDGVGSASSQGQWLQNQLAVSTAKWKLVYFHHPPYSSGTSPGPSTWMQWPFQSWGATAVLAGHEHNYERIIRNGFPYFVNGSGGKSLHSFGSPTSGSEVRYNADYGAMLVEVNTHSITFKFYNRTGTLIDSYIISSVLPPPPPSTFTAKINFQLSGTSVPSGYLPDYGSTYADRGNGFTYGWNVNNTANARDRGVLSDQRYDTLNHMQKSGGASIWELQVPNGDYQVRIVSGDPSYIDSIYKINVENQLAINATPSWGNQFFENTITVSVSDGKLTISNAPGASNNKISFIEVVSAAPPPPLAPSVTTNSATNVATSTVTLNGSANPNNDATTGWFRYSSTSPVTCNDAFGTRVPISGGANLGSGSSPVSYLENISDLTPNATYYYCALAQNSVGTGMGEVVFFTTAALPPPPDTTPPSTPTGLTTTPVSSSQIDLSWNASTDNVAVTGYRVYRDNILVDATTNTTYQNTGLSPSTIYSYGVSAIDEAGNESPLSSSASTTTPETPPFTAKINFQLSGTPVPTGYLADYGSTYADRGNGFTYGWDISNTANARDRGVLSDQRYDTLNHMQKSGGGSVWELQVPNADYEVHIVSGDPSYIDSVYKINVEGQLAINNTPTAGTKFFENTVTVTVSDGRLTISNAAGASNNKINFIDVVLAAPPPPPPLLVPSVTTSAATNVATSTVILNGSANPNNDATTGWFRYSLTNPGTCNNTFGTRVPLSGGVSLGSGTSPVSYLENISDLAPDTTYYYCALAQNPVGTGMGRVVLFTTALPPPPPDTTLPSTPTGLTATPVSSSEIDLSWNSSTDDVAVTGYQVYRNGSFIAAANSTNYQDTGLIASTAYAYQVSAIDEAGNESPLSSSASTTTPETPPFTAKINFQLSGTPVPTGYLADYGSTYADRGNGFTYGWDISNTANARDRDVNGDQRYDTLNHMQKPSGASIWELQVPNGTYQVRIVSGDPSYIDSIYKINVENQLAINATPSWGNQFFENTITVSVSDGKLTISNAPGASNNKISFIEVVSAAPPPPAQADYVIQVIQNLTIAPVSPIEGEFVSLSATVANQDTGAASSSSFTRLRLDIGNDGTYDITGEDQTTTALAASGTEDESWSNIWTAQAGTHKFEVCADVEDTLVESDETNNCTIQIFTISPPPPPTLEVSLTPTIKLSSATSSLRVVDLTAHASGTASGTINYTFYCDRNDPGTDITEPWDAKFDNETGTQKTAVDVCTYSLPGTYSAKVIAERDILAAEARAAIIVKEPPPPGAMGPLYQLPSNLRYFTLDGVNAVYLTGSHTWSNLIDRGLTSPPPAFDYTNYINKLKSWDHNFIRLWAWEPTRDDDATTDNVVYWNAPQPWVRTASSTTPSSTEESSTEASSTALDGLPKFDLYTLNEDYFNRLRQRVIEARDNGIYVSIMLFEGYNVDKAAIGPDYGWNAHPFHRSNNINGIDGDPNTDGRGREIHQLPGEGGVQAINDIQKTYVQKVIDTVNDLDNVLYEIANEAPNATTSWQYDLINYIKSYEAGKPTQHPVGMTFQWADGNNGTLFNSPADWISTRDSMTNPPVASGTKVIISDSDHHCGSNCTDGDWVWRDFTRGRNPIYMDDWGTRASSTFYEEKRTSARNAMGQTNLYAKKMNLAAMTPRDDLASTAFALANPGFEYLVYQPNSGTFSVDLSASSATFSVEWLNVQSGSTTAGGTITGGGVQTFTPPFSSPAVLYLKEQL